MSKNFSEHSSKSDVFNQLETHFSATKKWTSLDRAYVNFTHWAFVKGDHGSVPYQKNGFYVSWLRHNAYICQDSFPSIDLVIPMAFPNDKVLSLLIACRVSSSPSRTATTQKGLEWKGFFPKKQLKA